MKYIMIFLAAIFLLGLIEEIHRQLEIMKYIAGSYKKDWREIYIKEKDKDKERGEK